MNRWILSLIIVLSPLVYAANPAFEARIVELEREIQKLMDMDCEDLALKGQGQAAVACEDWRERELLEKRRDLGNLKAYGPSSSAPLEQPLQHEMSGDAVR